jgi:hypothetical protein
LGGLGIRKSSGGLNKRAEGSRRVISARIIERERCQCRRPIFKNAHKPSRRNVLSITRLGSFRAAALDLGISTKALSNAIGELEQRLGIRLFNRTTRSVSLTERGRGSSNASARR